MQIPGKIARTHKSFNFCPDTRGREINVLSSKPPTPPTYSSYRVHFCLSLALGKDSSENLLPLFNRTKWVRIVINLAEIYRRMRHRFPRDRGPFRKHEEEAEKGNFHLHRGLSRRGEMWNGRRWYYGTEAIAQNDASESPARQSTWV